MLDDEVEERSRQLQLQQQQSLIKSTSTEYSTLQLYGQVQSLFQLIIIAKFKKILEQNMFALRLLGTRKQSHFQKSLNHANKFIKLTLQLHKVKGQYITTSFQNKYQQK